MMNTRKILTVLPAVLVAATLVWPSAAMAQDAADTAWRAGFKAFQDGNPRNCVTQMQAALREGGEAYERWGWLHKVLGICLAQRGQRDEAISELQMAKELVDGDGDRFEVNHGLAQVYVARANAGDYDRAIAAENEASKYAGNGAQRALVAKTLGQSYYFKENWGNAITHLNRAAEARPTDADVAQKLGRAYLENGNVDQAMQWFQETLSLDRNNAAAVTNMGRLYLNEGDWAQSARYLEQAVRLDAQNMQVRNMLGRAYLGLSRYEDAIQQLEQVAAAQSNNGNAHYNLGQAHQADGNDAAAIDSYSSALRYLAAGTALRADALYDVGFVYEKVGRYDDALAALEDSAAINAAPKTTAAIERVKERIRRQKSGSLMP